MAECPVWFFVFLATLFELLPKTKLSVHGSGHVFMQPNNQVRYFVDGIPVSVHKEFSGISGMRVPRFEESSIYSTKSYLKFEPPLLDFKERHLGMPHHEKVTLFNVNNNKTIHMSSISGNTVHFHSSFFEDKIIPPLGNTTFNVVFLGREEGKMESNLFIHTSEGSFKYRVKGASVSSPYRLRPLVGVRIPLNSTYSPLIFMHNPHATPMQIVEVYSSGGEFHLELPSGELEGPKHLWEISPFYTKPVIRIRFHARAEKNHTAYVRIKVNKSDEVLVVPIEVEVSSHPGLYCEEDVIDFGIGGNRDEPRQVKLSVYNSWRKVLRVQSVTTSPVSKAVKIDFQPSKVPPDMDLPTQIATLTFDWNTAFQTRDFSGNIIIKGKQNQQKLIIPYVAQVLEGELEYNASVTQYFSDLSQHLEPRNFTVTNRFKVTVALSNVSVSNEVEEYFMVQNFSSVILRPNHTAVLFQLYVKKDTLPVNFKLESSLQLHTNVSTLTVPFLCYSGRLTKVIISRTNETELNFGTVGSGIQKEAFFAVVNNNPVPINLQSWGTNLTGAVIELLGVDEGNCSAAQQRYNFSKMKINLSLEPNHYAVFRMLIVAPKTEGSLMAEAVIKTQFERIVFPTRMLVAHGRLEILPEPLVLDNCFPGKLCVQPLHIRSLFSRTMALTSITSIPPDPRVSFSYTVNLSLNSALPIASLETSSIGNMMFDPDYDCKNQCYLGIYRNATANNQWLQTLGLPLKVQETDIYFFNTRYKYYMSMRSNSSAWQNLTLHLDTTEVRDQIFHAKVHLVWPKIASQTSTVNQSILVFPLTQIGNTTYRDLVLHNPSSKTLVLQLVMDWNYPHVEKLINSLPDRFLRRCPECLVTSQKEFQLEDNLWFGSYIQKLLGVRAHYNSLPLLLQPGETATTRLGFSPTKAGISSAMLFIRNNLTILEVVKLSGQAAYAQFKFGNRKPGSDAPLMFELAEKHLKDCEREKHRKFPVPNLTVKRSFTARNTGDLPIYVSGFNINGLPCEGYGFRILNCAPFQLLPNGTRKIDIAFTPDFTLARIQRKLTIDTSIGLNVNYSLITTLPPFFLASCSSVLGRPGWEPLLYYSAVSFMIFLLFCVLAAAFLESDRILKCAFLAMAKDKVIRSSSDTTKATSTNIQKNGDYKIGSGKCDGHVDWNLNNSSLIHQEKRNREPTNSSNTSSNHVYHKSNSWNLFEDKHIVSDTDVKEKCSGIKYDEPDTGYSLNSTSLVPIKSKKKLAKRNSNNSDASLSENVQEISSLKKSWSSLLSSRSSNSVSNQGGKSKLNLTENNKVSPSIQPAPDMEAVSNRKSLETQKDVKRSSQSTKRNNKCHSETVACSEEETSSTTTESSNNEEIEKERENLSSCNRDHKNEKKDKSKPVDYRDCYEGDCDDDDYEQDGHKKKTFSNQWKPNCKTILDSLNSERTLKSSSEETPKPPSLELPYKLKSSKSTNKDRKDKSVLKRRMGEKTATLKALVSSSGPTNIGTNSVRVSPPPRTTASCWGENRASFSDVVARNDGHLYSNIVAPIKRTQQPSVPAVFNENNNRKAAEPVSPTSTNISLGPIGPKKPSSSVWDRLPDSQSTASQTSNKKEPSNSFVDAATEPSPSEQEEDGLKSPPYTNDSVWEQHISIVTLLEDDSTKAPEEYQQQQFRENWPSVDSLWEPLYTPAVDNTLFSPVQQEDPTTNSGSVWGSVMSSVWSSSTWSSGPNLVAPSLGTASIPLVPSNTDNPIEEDSAEMDRGLGFDPFNSLNTIWFSTAADAWNSPGNK